VVPWGAAGGRAAREREDGPRSVAVLYLVGIETLRGLGASGRAPEARRPGASCIVNDNRSVLRFLFFVLLVTKAILHFHVIRH
jgi:hypothetical protein